MRGHGPLDIERDLPGSAQIRADSLAIVEDAQARLIGYQVCFRSSTERLRYNHVMATDRQRAVKDALATLANCAENPFIKWLPTPLSSYRDGTETDETSSRGEVGVGPCLSVDTACIECGHPYAAPMPSDTNGSSQE